MSGQLLSSKVVVVEEEPKVRGIPGLPTAVAGMVGITERGPIDQAVLCNSFEEFQEGADPLRSRNSCADRKLETVQRRISWYLALPDTRC